MVMESLIAMLALTTELNYTPRFKRLLVMLDVIRYYIFLAIHVTKNLEKILRYSS